MAKKEEKFEKITDVDAYVKPGRHIGAWMYDIMEEADKDDDDDVYVKSVIRVLAATCKTHDNLSIDKPFTINVARDVKIFMGDVGTIAVLAIVDGDTIRLVAFKTCGSYDQEVEALDGFSITKFKHKDAKLSMDTSTSTNPLLTISNGDFITTFKDVDGVLTMHGTSDCKVAPLPVKDYSGDVEVGSRVPMSEFETMIMEFGKHMVDELDIPDKVLEPFKALAKPISKLGLTPDELKAIVVTIGDIGEKIVSMSKGELIAKAATVGSSHKDEEEVITTDR